MLAGVTPEYGAGLGFLALLKEGEEIVPGPPGLEEPGLAVLLCDLFRPVSNGGSVGPGHPQVVALPRPVDGRDTDLVDKGLGQVKGTLLRNDPAQPEGGDLVIDLLGVCLLRLEGLAKVVLPFDLGGEGVLEDEGGVLGLG